MADPAAAKAALTAELEALHAKLGEAIQAYKSQDADVGTADDLLYRRSIKQLSSDLVSKSVLPEELWLDQSVAMAQLPAIRCFMKWGAFDAIPHEGSISYKDLADKIGAEEGLIVRFAWIMVSTGFLTQIGEDQLAHTALSKVYSHFHSAGVMFQIMFDEALIPYVHWPRYFAEYGLKEPQGVTHNPYVVAYGHPDKTVWEVMAMDPKRITDFAQSMNTLEQLLPIVGFYDFGWIEEVAKADPDRVLLVDVGGGKGQAIKAITGAYAGIPRERCVLQDRGDVIAEAERIDDEGLKGVKKTPHDFWTEQPVKGAAAYYIRRCLHDYPDDKCEVILKHLVDAMAADSKILITEQLVANPPSPLVAQTDLCMLNIAGKERSKANWLDLTSKVGLKIVGFNKAKQTEVCVVECVKA